MKKKQRMRLSLRLVLATCLLSALVLGVCTPSPALALTTSNATARPNSSDGNEVIGGAPTRLTWKGVVEEGEEVSAITLELPDGSSFQDVAAEVTLLDAQLKRSEPKFSAAPDGTKVTISFAEPVSAGTTIQLSLANTVLPEAGGNVAVAGSYQTADKETRKLTASNPFAVVADTPIDKIVRFLDGQPWVKAWCSVPFLDTFLRPQLLVTSLMTLFPGWLLCLGIVVAAYPFAILLGMGFALLKISRSRLLRAIAVVYVNVLRGTPLFLQIYIMFFGLPMLNINIDNRILGIIVIAINSSAYLAEIFRAGIQSIPQGQYEAAESLGMSRMQTMVFIIIPQTIRRVIPTVTSDFITSYKDTSLLSSVGVMELMMFAKSLTMTAGNMTPYMAAAIFYLIVTLPLIKVVGTVEKRIASSEKGGGPRPTKGAAGEDQAAESAPKMVEAAVHFEGRREEKGALATLLAPFVARPALGGVDDAV